MGDLSISSVKAGKAIADIGWEETAKYRRMETIVGTCIFSFSLPLLFLISFEVVVFLVFSVPYYPHLSCPGLVLFFYSLFLFLFFYPLPLGWGIIVEHRCAFLLNSSAYDFIFTNIALPRDLNAVIPSRRLITAQHNPGLLFHHLGLFDW